MSVPQARATSVDEIMKSSALVPRNGFHLEPRCRICRNDVLRKKVNDMLAAGASYAMVLRALGGWCQTGFVGWVLSTLRLCLLWRLVSGSVRFF